MIVEGFDWDVGNIEKCQKHGLSVEEIENFFYLGNFKVARDVKHSSQEERYFAIGRSKIGRAMMVVFVKRDKRIRPISARYMHYKEWKRYEEKDPTF